MTKPELAVLIAKITRFFPKFYENQDVEKAVNDWYKVGGFENLTVSQVDRAIVAYCNTAKFPPTLADIKAQMVESYLQDKPTAMQAFQRISSAVKKSTSRDEAVKQYNELPPILRKLVENPTVLRDWNQVSTESFQTVIMSAIRESYRELTTREAKYYAFPEELQMAEQWRVEAPDAVALPEPVKQMTYEDRITEMDRQAMEYRQKYLSESKVGADRISAFQAPMTANELKMLDAKKKHEEAVRLERMRV